MTLGGSRCAHTGRLLVSSSALGGLGMRGHSALSASDSICDHLAELQACQHHRADRPASCHRPSDPQVSTERPSSFSFACKAVGPCTGMSADLQTRDGVHTRRPTPWHQLLRAASVARAARPAAWSFRRVDAKVGPAISPVMCAGTAYQTPSSVVSVGASESPRCAPLPHRCRAAAAEAKNGPSVRAFERG